MGAAAGDTISLDFTLSLADGTLVDASGDEPLTIVIGRGDLFECLDQRLIGLSAGDHRRFEIPAAETSSSFPAAPVETFPRARFPHDVELKPGIVLGFEMPNGEEVAGTVVEVNEEQVAIDFTHPLAGHDLVFEVSIRSIGSHGRAEVPGS